MFLLKSLNFFHVVIVIAIRETVTGILLNVFISEAVSCLLLAFYFLMVILSLNEYIYLMSNLEMM